MVRIHLGQRSMASIKGARISSNCATYRSATLKELRRGSPAETEAATAGITMPVMLRTRGLVRFSTLITAWNPAAAFLPCAQFSNQGSKGEAAIPAADDRTSHLESFQNFRPP